MCTKRGKIYIKKTHTQQKTQTHTYTQNDGLDQELDTQQTQIGKADQRMWKGQDYSPADDRRHQQNYAYPSTLSTLPVGINRPYNTRPSIISDLPFGVAGSGTVLTPTTEFFSQAGNTIFRVCGVACGSLIHAQAVFVLPRE